MTYRSTPSTVTEKSPAEMLMGRKLRTRFSLLLPHAKNAEKTVKDVPRTFKEGDLVLVKNFVGRDRWLKGKVVSREGLFKYLVQLDNRNRLVHVDHLRKRYESTPESETETLDMPQRSDQLTPAQQVAKPICPNDAKPICPNDTSQGERTEPTQPPEESVDQNDEMVSRYPERKTKIPGKFDNFVM